MSNWIETTFNVSGGVTQAIAVILALAVVLLLFGLFIFILKRLMGASAPQNRARQPRIAVMDSAQVDARRRLVLIRRDNIEHLLLIGGPSDVVVEQQIVRNAPLAQQITPSRPAAQTAPPMPGHAPVKPAVAPGPEIPPTPEDIAAQNEPAPPAPSVQARTPVQPAAPVVPPAQPPAPQHASPSLSAPVAPPSAKAEAPAARPLSARLPDPSPRAPAVNAGPASASSTSAGALNAGSLSARPANAGPESTSAPSVSAADPGRGLNRAADLLRAATQNGFNRGTLRSQDADAPAVEATVRAPDVRAPGAAMPEPEESRTASTFKSLTRPFTARDRPSYGGSISPPASGPAARAKTVLAKPIDPDAPAPAAQRIEPVVASATHVAVSQSSELQESLEAELAGNEIRPDTPAAAEKPAADAGEPTPQAETVEAEKPAAEASAADAPDTAPIASDVVRNSPESEAQPEIEAETEAEAEDVRAEPAEDAETAKEGTAIAAAQPAGTVSVAREISLDLGDLLEDAPPAESEEEPASASATVPAPNAEPQPQTNPEDDEPFPASQPVSTAPVVRPPEPVRPEPARPAQKPSSGLGDRNPIEEEMAKILDELGGQSTR